MRRVAKEMDVEKATAAWVIRDVTIGRDCAFLTYSLWLRSSHGKAPV